MHITTTVLLWETEIAQFSALDIRVKEHFTDVAHKEPYPPPSRSLSSHIIDSRNKTKLEGFPNLQTCYTVPCTKINVCSLSHWKSKIRVFTKSAKYHLILFGQNLPRFRNAATLHLSASPLSTLNIISFYN